MDYYDEKERARERAARTCWYMILAILVALILAGVLSGCKSIQYVPVKETHTEHHHKTDTVRETDSIIDKQTTIIREVDSATMAQYGIRLKAAERAWLIQNDRLLREIERLQAICSTADSVRDSEPVPYPVEIPLTNWQSFCIDYGNLSLGASVLLVIFIIVWLVRQFRKRS